MAKGPRALRWCRVRVRFGVCLVVCGLSLPPPPSAQRLLVARPCLGARATSVGGRGSPQLDASQTSVWLDMSDDQLDAAAAVLSQPMRDQIEHVRWKRAHRFEGL
eukprot:3842904-Pyramimonas_sp.AAC.1